MHRSSNHRVHTWLAPVLGLLAIAAFPAAASAATPAPTPCASPPVGNSPCYTVAPVISPSNEWTNPPEGRYLSINVTPPVTGAPGTWSGTGPINYTYQWQDCDVATGATCSNATGPGATTRSYTVSATDVGWRLQLIVKATNSAGIGYAVLESSGAAVQAVPIDRSAPSVSGPTQDNQTLSANPGTWGGTGSGTGGITYGYQWRRCASTGLNCGAVLEATPSSSPTYVLQDADVGHTMSVVVTATNSVGSAVQGSFAENGVVTPGNTAPPSVSGTAQVGKTLTESHGSWLPSSPTYAYQWADCDAAGANCSAISGANSQAYTLTQADVGHTVVAEESATSNGATSSLASSAPTGVVQGALSSNGGGGGGAGNGGAAAGNGSGAAGNGGGGGAGNGQGGGTNAGQPAPTGSSPAPAAVTVTQLRGLLRNALAVHGKGAHISALLKHGGYSFTFAAPGAGTLAISWYRRLHGQKILIAKVTVRLHKTGKANLELVLTSKGRALLKGAGRMTLAAQGGFTPVGHSTTSASKTITLNK